MDYEQITIMRDQVNDLDDILRERRAELSKLDAQAEAPTAEQATRREVLVADIAAFEAQKKELSDMLNRALMGL